jgi:biopolymer transport protein TolR
VGFKVDDSSGSGMNEINVTPLIDIMLVMLIIFMLITPPALSQMAAKLPEKTESIPQDDLPKDQLVVSICEDGTVALNRKLMLPAEVAEQVRKRIRSKAKKVVFIDGHPDAPYDIVVNMMDRVRTAGADRVGLARLETAEEFDSCTPLPAAPEVPVDGAAPAAPAG